MSESAIDGVTALQRSYDHLEGVVADLDAGQLALPTNCPDWDVKAVLNHILGGALMYTLANDGRQAPEDAGDVVGDDPVRALADISARNLASWRSPGALEGERHYPWGTFPAPVGLVINVGEVALHTWDIGRAIDHDSPLDADVAKLVFDLYSQVPLDDMRANGVFGPEIEISESAPIQHRLLSLLSRRP